MCFDIGQKRVWAVSLTCPANILIIQILGLPCGVSNTNIGIESVWIRGKIPILKVREWQGAWEWEDNWMGNVW